MIYEIRENILNVNTQFLTGSTKSVQNNVSIPEGPNMHPVITSMIIAPKLYISAFVETVCWYMYSGAM